MRQPKDPGKFLEFSLDANELTIELEDIATRPHRIVKEFNHRATA